jgi:hypothetical protein
MVLIFQGGKTALLALGCAVACLASSGQDVCQGVVSQTGGSAPTLRRCGKRFVSVSSGCPPCQPQKRIVRIGGKQGIGRHRETSQVMF